MSKQKHFQSKLSRISGSNYADVLSRARTIYAVYRRKTKRNPYVRSPYFKKDKIFLSRFWSHIMEKRINPRTKRLKYYACCLDLLGNSTCEPTIKPDPGDANRRFYRFYGRSADGYEFIVQVVEEIKTGNKFLISCFPPGHRE